MDIKTELNKNKVLLALISSKDYHKEMVKLLKKLDKVSICYVTLNKTAELLREQFKKEKVNVENIIFIDGISQTIKQTPKQTDYCYYVSSPGALEQLSLMIGKFLKHNFHYLIFDSVTSLLVYEKKNPIIKFLSTVINNIQTSQTRAVVCSVLNQEHQDVMQEISMFVNKTITFKK